MKLLIVRLLIPKRVIAGDGGEVQERAGEEVGGKEGEKRRVQERQHHAVRIHCSTLAPQTSYSTPAISWRPDGTGVWVNGDDGVIRGFEACSGKHVASLVGHEGGSKVRCLASAIIPSKNNLDTESETTKGEQKKEEKEEWLVSGGFDRRLIIWKP